MKLRSSFSVLELGGAYRPDLSRVREALAETLAAMAAEETGAAGRKRSRHQPRDTTLIGATGKPVRRMRPWQKKQRTFRAGLRQSEMAEHLTQRLSARRVRYTPVVDVDGYGIIPVIKKVTVFA